MAKTHDIGRFFWFVGKFTTFEKDTKIPVLGRIPSQELDEPFRRSNSLMIRIPFTSVGIVLGWWKVTKISDEEDAFLQATYGTDFDLFDSEYGAIALDPKIDLRNESVRRSVRKTIASQVTDMDDEWTILDALGLTE